MNRLADARPTLASLDEAKQSMAAIARLECEIAQSAALAEKQIVAAKGHHAARVVQKEEIRHEHELALTGFILANKTLFKKPRKITTEFGSFGLQTVTDLVVTNEETAVQACLERGYEDCLKIVRTILKKAAQVRLDAGESIPGLQIRTGDTAVYKVAKALLDEAREKAMA